MKSKKIYLVHGTSSRDADWYPWLENKVINNLKIPFKRISLPHYYQPKPSEWDHACDEEIEKENNITLIGHSLGCIQVLHFIEQHDLYHVKLILVSGFDEDVFTLAELSSFTEHPVDYHRLLPKISNATVISAMDDVIVPYPYTQTLARHLRAKFILMPKGDHFLDTDGITKLPIVYQELKEIL